MKFGVVKKSLTVNRFVLHTLQRNITRLAAITRKTNIKLGILKRGTGKEPQICLKFEHVLLKLKSFTAESSFGHVIEFQEVLTIFFANLKKEISMLLLNFLKICFSL